MVSDVFSIRNKKAFQYDAYRLLVDLGGMLFRGVAVWGCCHEVLSRGLGAVQGVGGAVREGYHCRGVLSRK